MGKLLAITIVLFLYTVAQDAIAEPAGRGKRVHEGPEAVQEWFSAHLPTAKQKLTKLHFYFHDIVSEKNRSAVTVAKPINPSLRLPNLFGVINVLDDALTAGTEPDSKVIGHAQGIYGFASFQEIGLLMTLNYVFTGGEYDGSTLSVLGHNPVLHKYREMPIVGGTGVFRLAQGVATAQTVRFNMTSGDAVVEYNVFVLHYQ